MKEAGFFGLLIPEEYGGMNMSKVAFSIVQQELAKCHIAFCAIINTTNGCSRRILLEGTSAQKNKYLPKLAKGRMIASLALTEPSAGSDAAAIRTEAEKKGSQYCINGKKHFITNGPVADLFIVMAVTDKKLRAKGGITAFIVEKETSGVSIGYIEKAMGWRGIHESEIIFEDVKVPKENILGEKGLGLISALKTIGDAKINVAAMSLGMAEKILETTIAKVSEMQIDLRKCQSLRWLIADMATELYASRLMVFDAATKIDNSQDASMEASMCKIFATETLSKTVDRAFQIIGNEAYAKGSAIERICRDSRVLRIVDGASEIQKNVIGRMLFKTK
jgi:acyl-CoA dehydrogenase